MHSMNSFVYLYCSICRHVRKSNCHRLMAIGVRGVRGANVQLCVVEVLTSDVAVAMIQHHNTVECRALAATWILKNAILTHVRK